MSELVRELEKHTGKVGTIPVFITGRGAEQNAGFSSFGLCVSHVVKGM